MRYFVDVYYDVMLPSSGDAEKDKILAEKIARADLKKLKNREYLIGPDRIEGILSIEFTNKISCERGFFML